MLTPARLAKSGPKTDKKRGGNAADGFTIIETLIVLAVTAILAVSFLLLISGRQNKVEFQTAANDLQQQLQQIINETQSGYYPNNTNFSCTASPTGPLLVNSSPSTQGTNTGCIFVGKAIQFGSTDQNHPGADNSNFTVYPLTGNRYDSGGSEVSDIPSSKLVALAQGASVNSSFTDTSIVNYKAEDGLTFLHGSPGTVFTPTSGSPAVGSATTTVIALVTSFASYNSAGLNSGAQNFSLYAVPLTPETDSGKQIVDDIHNAAVAPLPAHRFIPLDNAKLCFQSGSTANQSAQYAIGDTTSGGLGVSLKIFGTGNCT